MEEYVVTCRSMEDLESFYDDMETPGGDLYIPDRAVPVYRRRPLSQNTHYMLTAEEAEQIRQDPRVLDVAPAQLIRSSVKLHSYNQTGNFSRSPYTDAMDAGYKNWALLRCLEGVQRSGWGSDGTKNQTATINLRPTGKNVDVIIIDGISGVPNHPEYAVNADGTGGSRYVQYDWYQLNSIASSLDDDAAALLTGPYTYVPSPSSAGNANHGAHTTGTVAGNTQGWARDANIYQIGPLGESNLDTLILWDYVRAFHRNKPINPATGRRNPTICNCSYGSTLTFPNVGATLGAVKQANRRGTTVGAFGTSPYTPFTAAQLNSVGMYNTTSGGTVYTAVPYYVTSTAADVTQAINDGIIIVSSSGNDSFFVDQPTGLDYNNWFVAAYGTDTSFYLWYQHRGTVPSAVPGVICVGAADATATEKKGYYSNCGPRVDVHAPGTWIVSSVADSTGEGWGPTIQDSRNSSYYIGRSIGTSMASPQVAGVLACVLEVYPSMTPAQALTYIQTYAKTGQLSDTGGVSPTWTSDTQSLQGAPNRFLYLPKETPSTGPAWPKQNYWIRPSTGRTYPRSKIRRYG